MKVLVLYAHPAQQHSRVNAAMAAVAKSVSGISFVDLYAKYPRFDLDVDHEQQMLLEHDAIIFQFPLMWYSTPSILKEWQDLVLEYGFAYGENGDKLRGKLWLTSVSMGSSKSSYGPDGHNIFQLRELLAPLEATANLCRMEFLAPLSIFEALKSPEISRLDTHLEAYRALLEGLRDDRFDALGAAQLDLLNADNVHALVQKATQEVAQ